MRQSIRRTPEQQKALVERWDELKAKGYSDLAAKKELGVWPISIRKWRGAKPKQARAYTRKQFRQDIAVEPATPTDKIACIIGTPEEISAVLRGMR